MNPYYHSTLQHTFTYRTMVYLLFIQHTTPPPPSPSPSFYYSADQAFRLGGTEAGLTVPGRRSGEVVVVSIDVAAAKAAAEQLWRGGGAVAERHRNSGKAAAHGGHWFLRLGVLPPAVEAT